MLPFHLRINGTLLNKASKFPSKFLAKLIIHNNVSFTKYFYYSSIRNGIKINRHLCRMESEKRLTLLSSLAT